MVRACIPFHKAILKKPVYIVLRYVFHICLIAVPVWLNGHIVLWEESIFEWSWVALPDVWADRLTLLFLGIATYFLIRRLAVPEIRHNSSMSDYLLILVAIFPFATGYFLASGSLDSIAFFYNHLETLHILSAEAMLTVAVFLFYKTQFNVDTCTGCAACEISCPTGTLLSGEEGRFRIFSYLHYQCICCGACVKVCPEDAAALKHEIRPLGFFQVFSRRKIQSVALTGCQKCGALFAPEPQIEKANRLIAADFFQICPRCRADNYVKIIKPASFSARSQRGRQPSLK